MHITQAFSCLFPSQFPSGFSISACLGRGIFNPLWLRSSGAEKGRSLPLGIYWVQGICKASFCFPGGRKWGMFWLIKSDLPFSSVCGGVRNLFSSGTAIPGCQPTVQRQSERRPWSLCVYMHVCMWLHVHMCTCVWGAGRGPIHGRCWGAQITSLPALAGVHAWWCPPACVWWICPCVESRVDAPGCQCLWRGMLLPLSVFSSPTVASPGPITHHGAATPCWGTNIWDCSNLLLSGMMAASFQGCPHVSLHHMAAPWVGFSLWDAWQTGLAFGCLFLQCPRAKRKLHPVWVMVGGYQKSLSALKSYPG